MRSGRWGITVTLFALLVQLFISKHDPWARGAQGDGYYAWLFARSIAYDGDIDFTNDYAICGDRWSVGVDRGTGHPNNNFAFGQALFWVPALELARAIIHVPDSEPRDVRLSCVGPRVSFVLYLSPIVGALTLFLTYLMARRLATDGAAALAAGLVALAGTNLAYAGFMVSYSHIYASFAVALLLWTTLRAKEARAFPGRDKDIEVRRWCWVAFAIALAAFQRPTALVFALVPFALAVHSWIRREWSRARFLAVLSILAVGAFAGIFPTLMVNRYLFGGLFAVPQGRYFLFPGHAHPWLVLFAPRGGLFFSAPTAWFGVVGLTLGLRDRKWALLFGAMTVAAAIEIYVAGIALDWHESWGFGARRLTTLTPMLVFGAALLFERLRRWFGRRPARARVALGLGTLMSATIFTFGLVDGSAHNVIVPDSGHSQADFYGAGSRWFWNLMDRGVGDLAIFPAEIVFHYRYGLPPTSFRDATEPFVYARAQRGDLHFTANAFPLADARMSKISVGLDPEKGDLVLRGYRGRIVFAAEWPFATAYVVTVRAEQATHLRLGAGHLLSTAWFGNEVALKAGEERTLRFSIPPGEFDSGLNELVLERDGVGAVAISAFRIVDEAVYPPAMGP